MRGDYTGGKSDQNHRSARGGGRVRHTPATRGDGAKVDQLITEWREGANVQRVLRLVDGDRQRAEVARGLEARRDKPRATLLKALDKIVG